MTVHGNKREWGILVALKGDVYRIPELGKGLEVTRIEKDLPGEIEKRTGMSGKQ